MVPTPATPNPPVETHILPFPKVSPALPSLPSLPLPLPSPALRKISPTNQSDKNELDSFLPLIGLFSAYVVKRARRPDWVWCVPSLHTHTTHVKLAGGDNDRYAGGGFWLGLDFQVKMPIDADWKDLLVYTNRVKKNTYEEDAHNAPTSIFPVFESRCPRQWVLPSLTHLVWMCDTPAGLDHGKAFISTGLRSLILEVGHKFLNLANFLAALSARTRLNSFLLASLGTLPEDFSRVMASQDLSEKVSTAVSGALDPKIGKWVSELPELRSLKLDLTGQGMGNVEGFFDKITPGSGWSTSASEESRDSGVFAEIKKTTTFSRSGDGRRGACPRSPGGFQDQNSSRLPLCYFTSFPRLAVFEIDSRRPSCSITRTSLTLRPSAKRSRS